MNSASPDHWEDMHYKLVSLWDLIMQYFPAEKFLAAYHQIAAFNQMQITLLSIQKEKDTVQLVAEQFIKFKGDVDDLRDSLRDVGLEMSLASADKVADELAKVEIKDGKADLGKITLGRFENYATDLINRLPDEIKTRLVLVIPASEKKLYESKEPLFGKIVENAFPNTAEDIGEAGKCLALGRGTACVFHLMRVMEASVQKLGDVLKVTIIDKNNKELAWGQILGNIDDAVKKRAPGRERDRLSRSCALLYHVKQAWRNETMHPKQTYTPEEAKVVFGAVKAFMNDLASLV